MSEVSRMIGQWMCGRDTGVSSLAVAAATLGAMPLSQSCQPHDSDDFGRCYRLIALVPEARDGVRALAGHSVAWERLAENWDGLSALYADGDLRAVSKAIRDLDETKGWRSYRYAKNERGQWAAQRTDLVKDERHER